MQDLTATQAREIDKASVTEAEAVLVNNEMVSTDRDPGMKAGDFYFRANLVTKADDAPKGLFNRFFWKLIGKPYRITERIIYTVVISCPFCGLPIITGFGHHITTKRPLTIAEPIACPYSARDIANAHAFRITEGNITAA